MPIVACTYESHAPAMLAILNEAIVHTTALYDYQPRTLDMMATWFATKAAGGYPVPGLMADGTTDRLADGTTAAAGTLLGFATYGAFRVQPAYKYTVEHSVYVHQSARGCGYGRLLMRHLIAAATARDVHVMIGCIDAQNTASIALHEALGFVHSGTIRQAGFKFGRWLDASFYQLTLATPAQPVDG